MKATCHQDRPHYGLGQCKPCYERRRRAANPTSTTTKTRKPSALVPSCHPERRYSAKGMCNPCYQRTKYKKGERRGERIPTCHPDKPHGGNGLCKACYFRIIYYPRLRGDRLPAANERVQKQILDDLGRVYEPRWDERRNHDLTAPMVA